MTENYTYILAKRIWEIGVKKYSIGASNTFKFQKENNMLFWEDVFVSSTEESSRMRGLKEIKTKI